MSHLRWYEVPRKRAMVAAIVKTLLVSVFLGAFTGYILFNPHHVVYVIVGIMAIILTFGLAGLIYAIFRGFLLWEYNKRNIQ